MSKCAEINCSSLDNLYFPQQDVNFEILVVTATVRKFLLSSLPRVPEKAGPENCQQMRCCIINCFTQSFFVRISYCHIIYLSLAKNWNDFHLLVFKIWLQTLTYVRNHFCNFSVEWLTDCIQCNAKSCKIGLT